MDNINSALGLYILFWVGIFGLCLGSFYNVVILRFLSNESIVFPASKCPKCGNKLLFWHNIPVLSYLILRGKCYFCKEKISIQYPIIELTSMILFMLSYVKFGLSITTLFVIYWLSSLLIMSVTDIKEKVINGNIAIAMGISGLIYNYILFGKAGLISSILGLIVAIAILELFAVLGYLTPAKTRAMADGDTYIAAAIGAIFGVNNILWILLYSIAAFVISILPYFLYYQFKNNNKVGGILAIMFIISTILFLSFYELLYLNLFVISIIIGIGIALCVNLIKNLGNKANQHYIPYGPALALGTLYYVFFIFSV